jgi:hypothetical protein
MTDALKQTEKRQKRAGESGALGGIGQEDGPGCCESHHHRQAGRSPCPAQSGDG